MKYAILLFLSLVLSVSCSQSGEQKTEEPTTPAIEEKSKPTSAEVTAEDMGVNTMMRGQYISAAVNAEATELGFLLDNGEQVVIRISNEEGAKNPIVPTDMLDEEEGFGGFASANSEMIGKFFTLEKDASGNFVQVIYSTGKPKE